MRTANVETQHPVLRRYHHRLSPMSPFSMARMSGLSLQSVWGMVPTISWCSSFSRMLKQVKLYICQTNQRRTREASPREDTGCMNQSDLGRVGRSGRDPPQQLTPRNCLNTVCPWRGTLLQVLHSRKTNRRPPLKSFSRHRGKTAFRNPLCFSRLAVWNLTSRTFLSSVTFLLFFLWASKAAASAAYRHSVHFPYRAHVFFLLHPTHTWFWFFNKELSEDAKRLWWGTHTH